MLRALFNEELSCSGLVIEKMNEYGQALKELRFTDAGNFVSEGLGNLEVEKRKALLDDNEALTNQIYIAVTYLEMFGTFAEFWASVVNRYYAESWNSLQDIQDKFKIIKRFSPDLSIGNLELFELAIMNLEKLYPYKFFASPEFVIREEQCSICGMDVNGFECSHLMGDLYCGQMAYSIVGKIESINAVAIVEHPVDKRAIIEVQETKENFSAIEYLASNIEEGRMSPWNFREAKETSSKKTLAEYDEIGRNDKCPCGSNKKFKRCCLHKRFIEVPHIQLIIDNERVLVFNLQKVE